MAGRVFGIDFGTSTLKIYKKNKGVIFDQKNIIAVRDDVKEEDRVYDIGDSAYEMYEKNPPNISVHFPVRGGVIADIANMLSLLNTAFDELTKEHGKFAGAEFLVAAPTDITEVEKRAFFDLVRSSNAKAKRGTQVHVVEKPIADALGADLDVMNASGVMIVDIGADTTEVSVISLGGIVLSKLIPIGGNKLDEAIVLNVKKSCNLIIGQKTAEIIKKQLGCALPPKEEKSMTVSGIDVLSGLPVKREVTASFIYDTISEYMSSIVDAVRVILEKTPPEISSDIIDSGIYLTGGSSSIHDLDTLIAEQTELNINLCPDPANTVVKGLGRIIEDNKFASLALTLKQTYYGG